MSTDVSVPEKKAPAALFRERSSKIAGALLTDWVGPERAREATGRIATAISASAAAARDPSDFYECTPQSIGKVIAISALTGIYPGTGQGALAYAIPRRPRKGDPPQLQYQLSHRGVNALANRANRTLLAVPVGYEDEIDVDDAGEVRFRNRDFDNPPATEVELRGVVVVVKDNQTGTILTRQWVAKSIINSRREQSDSFRFAENPKNSWAKDSSPWHKWYVEMALKTAMHYAINRGWCVIDDTEAVRALQVDSESDFSPLTIEMPEGASKTDVLTDRLLGAEDDASIEPEVEAREPVEVEAKK